MAGKIVTAIRRQEAEARLLTAVSVVSAALDIDATEIPVRGKDADVLRADQMEAMADVMEAVAAKVVAKPKKAKAAATDSEF